MFHGNENITEALTFSALYSSAPLLGYATQHHNINCQLEIDMAVY
jgi:hypothetical protein